MTAKKANEYVITYKAINNVDKIIDGVGTINVIMDVRGYDKSPVPIGDWFIRVPYAGKDNEFLYTVTNWDEITFVRCFQDLINVLEHRNKSRPNMAFGCNNIKFTVHGVTATYNKTEMPHPSILRFSTFIDIKNTEYQTIENIRKTVVREMEVMRQILEN